MIHATINQFARKTANGVLARRHTVPRALLSGIVTRPLTEDTPKHLEDCLLVQDMLYRVRKLNCVPDEIGAILVDFQVDGIKLGKVSSNKVRLKMLKIYLFPLFCFEELTFLL